MTMDYRVAFLFSLIFAAYVVAIPASDQSPRAKRDVMESMKNAWNEVVRTFSDAGDAVVHVFKPTEKSTIDKIADGIKSLGS